MQQCTNCDDTGWLAAVFAFDRVVFSVYYCQSLAMLGRQNQVLRVMYEWTVLRLGLMGSQLAPGRAQRR
jgi:hypothetical protein